MDKIKFEKYLSSMLMSISKDPKIILLLEYGYTLYREGRSNYVELKYGSKHDAVKAIEKYVRARAILENLLMNWYPLETVNDKFSEIDWAIQQEYHSTMKVKKELWGMAKKFLTEEYPFTDNELKKIFSLYNEIIAHDPIALNSIYPYNDKEEQRLIQEYKNNIGDKNTIGSRVYQYIKELKKSTL